MNVQQEKDTEKKRKSGWLIILLLLLLLSAVGGFLASRYWEDREADRIQKEIDADVGILPGMTEDEIKDRLNRIVAEGRLNISINNAPVFTDGRSPGNIRIENIKGNKYSFAVTVTCIGASEDAGAVEYVNEVVMKTGLIDPGSYVEEKKLDVNLPKGKYTCVATFTAYKTDVDAKTGKEEYAEVGSAGTQILITVEN